MTLNTPLIIVNCKTYDQATGNNAQQLALTIRAVQEETGVSIALCPQAPDIYRCAQIAPVIAQFEQSTPAGGHTGNITVKAIKENGALGSLINHSECRVPVEEINKLIHQLRHAGLISIVCVKDEHEASALAKLEPDMIAIEPPALIGGNVSVTSANPDIITKSVQAVNAVNKNIYVLCGAGVKTTEDVRKAIELGAAGVLVASGVTTATNQKQALLDLTAGI